MNTPVEQKIAVFRKIHADMKAILEHDKCRACTCFHSDVLAKVQDTLRHFNASEPAHKLENVEADFDRWVRDIDLLKAHG